MLVIKKRKIDDEIVLVPYTPKYKMTLAWYQDPTLVKQVDNVSTPYTLQKLKRMYHVLKHSGWLYYIKYQGTIVGDFTLYKDGHIAIVISKDYQNKHIGRRVIKYASYLAKIKGLSALYVDIYPFNKQSIKMFTSVGFVKVLRDSYAYYIKDEIDTSKKLKRVKNKDKKEGESNENS